MNQSRPHRYRSLDIWRGVACLTVAVFHSVLFVATKDFQERLSTQGGTFAELALYAATYLWIGVALFFVISGYCIAAAADAHRKQSQGVLQFFFRRFKRIYPPYWACLLLCAIVLALIPEVNRPPSTELRHPGTLTPANWLGNITLTEEWRPNVNGGPPHHLFGQAWTLCYEEQFYFMVGMLLVLFPRWFFPMVAIASMWVYLNVADVNGMIGNKLGWDLARFQIDGPGFFFDGLWLAFAAGVLVYYRLVHARPGRLVLEGFLLLAAIWGWSLDRGLQYNNMTLIRFVFISALFGWLLIRLRPLDDWLTDARVLRPLRFCGRMCYSVYLVHGIVCIILAWNLVRLGITSPVAPY